LLLEDEIKAETETPEEEDILNSKLVKRELWEAMYIQACYWSFGASIVNEARPDFDEYVKKICGFIVIKDEPEKLATISKFIKNIKNCHMFFSFSFNNAITVVNSYRSKNKKIKSSIKSD